MHKIVTKVEKLHDMNLNILKKIQFRTLNHETFLLPNLIIQNKYHISLFPNPAHPLNI